MHDRMEGRVQPGRMEQTKHQERREWSPVFQETLKRSLRALMAGTHVTEPIFVPAEPASAFDKRVLEQGEGLLETKEFHFLVDLFDQLLEDRMSEVEKMSARGEKFSKRENSLPGHDQLEREILIAGSLPQLVAFLQTVEMSESDEASPELSEESLRFLKGFAKTLVLQVYNEQEDINGGFYPAVHLAKALLQPWQHLLDPRKLFGATADYLCRDQGLTRERRDVEAFEFGYFQPSPEREYVNRSIQFVMPLLWKTQGYLSGKNRKDEDVTACLKFLQYWAPRWGLSMDEDLALFEAAFQEGEVLREEDKALYAEIKKRYQEAQVEKTNILIKLDEQERLANDLKNLETSILETQWKLEKEEEQAFSSMDGDHRWNDGLLEIQKLEARRERLVSEHNRRTTIPSRKRILKPEIEALDQEILRAQEDLIEYQERDLHPYKSALISIADARHYLAESKVRKEELKDLLEKMDRHDFKGKKNAVEKKIKIFEAWLRKHDL